MRSVPRRFAVLGLSALAMAFMTVGAASAQAQFTVYDNYSGLPCSSLVVEGNDVSGGCLVEDLDGAFVINSFGAPALSFWASFDIRIDSAGQMYAVNQEISAAGGYPRRPCEDEGGEVIPWEGASIPTTFEFCIESPYSGSPGGGATQVVPFYVTGNYGTYGYIEGMYQTDNPFHGIAAAEFDNKGDDQEVVWEWAP